MQNGVDLVSFDLFGQHPGWSQLPLLKYTCNKGMTWTNSINKVEYNIPDQFAQQPISIPDDVTSASFHQSTSTMDKKKYMSMSIGAGYKFGMFSSTMTLSHSYQVIVSDTRLYGQINSSISAFKIDIIPYELSPDLIQLSSNAQAFINSTIRTKAPIFNESTVAIYEQFFEYFGTHFFSSAYAGGVFHLLYETDLFLLYTMNETEISDQAQASFFNFLLFSGAITGSKKEINANFSSMTTVIETCKGGSFCPSNPSDYDNWQISVASTPWIMSAEFIPMHVLLYDDDQIKQSFEKAIANHLRVGYLKNEIMGNLDLVKQKIEQSINETSTFNETHLCLYPHFDSNSITTHCNGSDKDCCDGPNGYKSMWIAENEYHSVVTNGDLNAFYQKLKSAQDKLMSDVESVQNYTNMLLANMVIEDEALFNVTADIWENVMNVVQTKPVWELCKWVNKNSCSNLKANNKHVCHTGPCDTKNFGTCHAPVQYNLTYFEGLASFS